MSANIKNFITIRWDKKEMENPPPWLDTPKKDLSEHVEIHERLFWQLAKQIGMIYPASTLHVITNKKIQDQKSIKFHLLDVPSSHMAKLEMYGLVDEPSMYIDTDILLVSKFKEEHLVTDLPFLYFGTNGKNDNLQSHAKKILPCPMPFLYNAGIVWIPQPSKPLVAELQNIHEEYFCSKEVEERIGFEIGDEHASTLYAFLNNMQMKTHKEINKPRQLVSPDEIQNYQSIHYTGYKLDMKKKCLEEFKQHSLAYRSIKL